MVDLDVPRQNTRVTNLHWLAPNVDVSKAQAVVPNTTTAAYLQPSPPKGDTAHRYVFLMYAQQANFSVPAQFSNVQANRIGFDVNAFAKASGLGAPVAANFIMVQQWLLKRKLFLERVLWLCWTWGKISVFIVRGWTLFDDNEYEKLKLLFTVKVIFENEIPEESISLKRRR